MDKHVADVMTYDDLLFRLRNIIESLKIKINTKVELFGQEMFKKLFPVILTDNGSEFSNPLRIEADENGEIRTRIFYCDSNRPDQKGSIEVNHEFIRRVIPKGTSLDEYTQYDINLMMSHINSYGRKRLNDRSPYRVFKVMYGEEVIKRLGIEKIPRDEINLTPGLLKR